MFWKKAHRGALALTATAVLLFAAPAAAQTLAPPKPDVFLGASDRGSSRWRR